MEVRVTEPTRWTEPPQIRTERLDWHALELDDQGDVTAYRLGSLDLEACSVRAQVFLRRHHNA